MRLRLALVLVASLGAVRASAEPTDPLAPRDEAWWRAASTSRERAVESSQAALATCEEREAPPAYDGVAGIVTRSQANGRLRFVGIKRCDAERDALAAAQAERERFEEEARREEVPPGWLRP